MIVKQERYIDIFLCIIAWWICNKGNFSRVHGFSYLTLKISIYLCVVFSLWLWTIYDQCQCELIWISFIQRKRLRSWYQYIFLNFCSIYHSISWRWSVENCFKKRSKTNNTALILSIKYFKTPSNEDQTSVDSESKDKGDSIWPFY